MLHLIHPVLVHATVAFLIVGGIVEAYGIARRREGPARFGGALVVWGTVSLAPTIIAGFIAENVLTLSAAAADAVDDHERFGLLTFSSKAATSRADRA